MRYIALLLLALSLGLIIEPSALYNPRQENLHEFEPTQLPEEDRDFNWAEIPEELKNWSCPALVCKICCKDNVPTYTPPTFPPTFPPTYTPPTFPPTYTPPTFPLTYTPPTFPPIYTPTFAPTYRPTSPPTPTYLPTPPPSTVNDALARVHEITSKYRTRVGLSDPIISPVLLDSSKRYAANLCAQTTFQHSSLSFRQNLGNFKGVAGENLLKGSITDDIDPDRVMNGFYKERWCYRYGKIGDAHTKSCTSVCTERSKQAGCQTGHFTQLMSSTITHMGCAYKTHCGNSYGGSYNIAVVVCHFASTEGISGNYVGTYPFSQETWKRIQAVPYEPERNFVLEGEEEDEDDVVEIV